jgi:hypothetical protein
MTKEEKENYPEATCVCFFGMGMPTFCLFDLSAAFSRGWTPYFLPERVPRGGPWFSGVAPTTSSSGKPGDGTVGKA